MSYHLKSQRRLGMGADASHGPSWYKAIGSYTSQPPGRRLARSRSLGSLGDDAPAGPTTLSTPTLTDPATVQWQNDVLAQLRVGAEAMRIGETQKWLQIAATLSIPLAAAVWKMIFKKGASDPTV